MSLTEIIVATVLGLAFLAPGFLVAFVAAYRTRRGRK